MRPGTKVEVFDDGQVIAAGEAADGTAHVRVVHQFGLPLPGTVLKLRQRMCPKPPPPGGATESVGRHSLPHRAAPGQEGARWCAACALDTLLLLGKSTGPQFPYTID